MEALDGLEARLTLSSRLAWWLGRLGSAGACSDWKRLAALPVPQTPLTNSRTGASAERNDHHRFGRELTAHPCQLQERKPNSDPDHHTFFAPPFPPLPRYSSFQNSLQGGRRPLNLSDRRTQPLARLARQTPTEATPEPHRAGDKLFSSMHTVPSCCLIPKQKPLFHYPTNPPPAQSLSSSSVDLQPSRTFHETFPLTKPLNPDHQQ